MKNPVKRPHAHILFILLALIATVTLSGVMPKVLATSYEVGVKAGDWAQYSVDGGWNPANASIPMPQAVQDAMNTQWINITVQNVVQKTVFLTRITQFRNNIQRTATLWSNVETGAGTLNYTVIASDLSLGDNVISSSALIRILMTSPYTYANVERETNYSNTTETTQIGTRWYEWRWDKASGIMDEMHFIQQDSTGRSLIFITISRTDIWAGGTTPASNASPIDPEPIILGGAFIVAAILAVYAVSRRPKTKRIRARRYSPKKTRLNYSFMLLSL